MHNSRLDLLSEYPFPRLRQLLKDIDPPENMAPLSLAVGEPQHAPPAILNQTLSANLEGWNKYPPTAGTDDLRLAIAQWLMRRYGLAAGAVDPDRHVLAVDGTREALYLAVQLVMHGDGQTPVLLPNPFYQVYFGGVIMAGGKPVFLNANRENGHLPDLSAVDPGLLDQAAAMFLCSPSNPEGGIADLDQLTEAVRLARTHDFVLLMDECYAEIYDRSAPAGVLQACAGLGGGYDNVLVFHSLSKRSSAAGLRSGFVAGDPHLIERFIHLRNFGGATLPLPLQAVSAALWRDDSHVEENRALYRRKYDLADEILGAWPGYFRPQAGIFLWLDVGDGEAMTRRLWAEVALRALPGAYLAAEDQEGVNPGRPFIRLAMVHDLDTTRDGLGRVARVLGL